MSKGVIIGEPTYRVHSRMLHIGVQYFGRKYNVRVNKPKRLTPSYVSRWSSMRLRAKKKGLECDMTAEDVRLVIESPCVYCGASKGLSELDRKDSSLGYLKSNVAPACRRCNTIKNNVVTYDEMLKIVDILGWRVNV